MRKILSFIFLVLTVAITMAVCTSAVDINEAFVPEAFEHEGTTLPYRLYLPEDLDETKSYPLVLFLHGAGERGNDNEAQLKNMLQVLFDRDDGLMEQAVVIAPQCPEGDQWVDTPWENGNYSVAEVPESNEAAAAFALVSAVADKYSCDLARFYVMGISMGGFGAWDLMMRHPGFFAAGIPVCGGADPEMAEIFMETPVFTFHGTADTSVPYEGTEAMVEAVEDLGSRVINFISYNGDGHGIWDKAASEDGLMEWLFDQRLELEAVPDDTEPADTEETEKPDESTADSEAPAGTESGTPNVTDDTAAPDSEDDGGFPAGAMVAIVAAVVICVGAALTVVLKKKK